MHPVCLHTIFSTLYTTLPHNLIKDKLVDLIERTLQREGSLYIACNDRNAFFTSDAVRNYNLWSCQKVCEALTFLLDNIYIRFGIVATCIAAHFAVCHALYNNKNKKIGKNRC